MLDNKLETKEKQNTIKVKQSHTSFYWAMRLLPREKRDAMFAIYTFCRKVDDIVDNPGPVENKRNQLKKWRDEIIAIFEGEADDQLSQQILRAKKSFALRKEDFLAIIEGMLMDLGDKEKPGRVRIQDMKKLTIYCDKVAGAVGRLSNQVFNIPNDRSYELASTLGRALQLTNILRDLREDAKMDRLYIPREILKKNGIKETEPHAVMIEPLFPRACNELTSIAENDFKNAETILIGIERSKARPVIIMKDIYKLTLNRLIKRGWHNLDQPVKSSNLKKIWIIIRSGLPRL